jgi:uncharacterized sporulation protein YeaH/YhbH (DUF444 family)
LRHDAKVRDSVRRHLPELVSAGEMISGTARTVRVPVRLLEHYRFRLRHGAEQHSVGQGAAKPGDVFADPTHRPPPQDKCLSGGEGGEVQLLLELKVEDIVEWLWEEMRLPNLKPHSGPSQETQWAREGWDRRGARSRLDRRRSFKELVKRRGAPGAVPAFTDDDLRFRQLAQRRRPAVRAAVFFLLDVSGSMSERDRQLAKSFFFWAMQGLRRQYRTLETVFVAHATEAWEFSEPQFFQVSGTGGTVASTGFGQVSQIIADRFAAQQHNVYVYYASDGDNAASDAAAAREALGKLLAETCFCGYVEVAAGMSRRLDTETGRLFGERAAAGGAVDSCVLCEFEDIWAALRTFFAAQERAVEDA